MKYRLFILVLWLAFFLRIHANTLLPPFNDESHHIRRAEQVWQFDDPDLSFTLGKLLTYYWFGLFKAERLQAIWITRTATSLFALLGLAAAYALGRKLWGHSSALGGLILLSFAPFMLFFDRLALTDPITAVCGILTILGSVWFLQNPTWQRGCGVGILAWLAILAKLTGLPFAALPIWAVLSLKSESLSQKWADYRKGLFACYFTLGALLTPFILRIIYKELSGNRISVVDTHLINTQSPLQTLLHNLEHLWEANWKLNSPLLVLPFLLLLPMMIWRIDRKLIFLAGCVLLPWSMSLGAGGVLSTRYLQLGILPLFLLLVGLFARLPRPIAVFIAGFWLVSFALPFSYNLWTDPLQNSYPARDEWEYFSNFSAGYGLVDAAKILPTLESTKGQVPVIGLVGSCHQLRLYLDEFGSVRLSCPQFGWAGEYMDEVADLVDQTWASEGLLYLLVEPDLPFTDLSRLRIQHEVIAVFPRPHDGMRVEIWRVSGDKTPQAVINSP